MQRIDLLLTDCRAATMVPGEAPYGAIEDAAIAVHEGRIVWVGPRAEFPDLTPVNTARLGGRWVTPGLIDCHTHLVFGGDRIGEFEARLGGATYEEIALAGTVQLPCRGQARDARAEDRNVRRYRFDGPW